MVLYARSDVVGVALPPEYGCGSGHTRPEGAKTWGIDCPPCEARLAGDPQWSKSRFRIPPTPDEEEEAKELKERADAALERARLQEAREAAATERARLANFREEDDGDVVITGSEGSGGSSTSVKTATRPADYSALTKTDLKDLARDRGITVGGTREDLIARHLEHDSRG